MTKHNYEGQWELLPELSFYQDGSAPDQGRYEITVEGDDIKFSVEWAVKGERQAVSFAGKLDGKLSPTDKVPGGQVSFTRVDEDTLESALVVNGVLLAYARRQVSRDGQLLAILQENSKSDGMKSRITQVYRRLA